MSNRRDFLKHAGLLAASLWQQRERIDTAELLERAKAYDARIVRDSWGVPHIFGARDRASAMESRLRSPCPRAWP